MSIVVNIKHYIKEKGLKQKYVAERLNMTQQEFSNILNGRKEFKTEYVVPMCNALGITANELFTSPEQTTQNT